jgi:NADP-dependent 3-hydroxy acid dehydrogenase YdfG
MVVPAGRRKSRVDDVAAEIIDKGGAAASLELDVTDAESVASAVRVTAGQFGGVDVLVNNAGVGWIGPIVGADVSQWHRTVEVNLLGVLNMTHAALPYLVESPLADLVMISSDSTRFGGFGAAVYSATKKAVEFFADALRVECSAKGVRVTSILPGLTHGTELPDLLTDPITRQNVHELFENTTTLAPDDVAAAVIYAVNQPRRACAGEIFIQQTQLPRASTS